MAYNALNNLIDAYIYANGVQAITGQILNGVLKQMVSELGSGYHLMGVAGPGTVPEQNDYAMSYFAATAGEYTGFGGITLAAGEVAVLLTYGNGSWSKQTIYNVPTGTADLDNTANFITNAVTDLVNYYTKTEIDGQMGNVDTALADRYTKSETDTKLGDYYKKTETYDKDEVDSIVAALSRQEYIVAWDGLAAPDVSAIPAGVTVTYSGTPYTGTLAASASTVNKIYMVWNGTAYDMYGTSQDGGYSWVPMGTTTVNLSQYAMKAELVQLGQSLMQNYPLDNFHTSYGWVNPDGSITDRSTYRIYTIPLNGLYQFILFKGRLGNSALIISFYDTNGNILSSPKVYGSDTDNIRTYSSEIPADAVSAKCCTYNTEGVQIFLQKESEKNDEEKLLVDIKCKEAASYYGNDDFYNRVYGRMNATTKEITSSPSASLLYYHADGVSSVEVIQRTTQYSSFVNCVVIAFTDAGGTFIGDVVKPDKIGLHSYSANVPSGAKTIIVGIGDNTLQYNVFLYKKQGLKDIEFSTDNPVSAREIDGYDYFLRGYISHNGNGEITSSGSTKTYKFKNWGYKYVKLNAYYTSGDEGELASFNAISFYSVDEWLGGQGYMKAQSIQPRYSARRKEYLAEIPDGCGIICITIGNSTFADSLVTFYNGKEKDYLPILGYDTDVRFNLPLYYTKQYLDGKVNLIRSRIKLNASNSDCFYFMTDEHAERNNMWSMGLIKYLNARLHIKKLFSGGDFSHEGINEYGIALRRKAFNGEIYQAIGNHEYLNYSWDNHQADSSVPFVATTEDELYYGFSEYYDNNVKFGDRQRHYFYFDNEIQEIRYIFLNAYSQGDGVTNSAQHGYEQTQLNWFENVALDVESGWSIVIITHMIYEHQSSTNEVYVATFAEPVKDIIEQYDGNGKIIAVFQGHTHRDRIQYLKNGAIPVIITTSDQNGSYVWSSEEGEYVRGGDVERESGTINEQAFDVVTIDKTLKRISCVRIGCPARDGTEPGGELVGERIVYWQ